GRGRHSAGRNPEQRGDPRQRRRVLAPARAAAGEGRIYSHLSHALGADRQAPAGAREDRRDPLGRRRRGSAVRHRHRGRQAQGGDAARARARRRLGEQGQDRPCGVAAQSGDRRLARELHARAQQRAGGRTARAIDARRPAAVGNLALQMDAVRGAPGSDAPPLPPEAPLVMPVQSLSDGRRARERPPTSPRSIGLRRAVLLAATAALTALAAYEMYLVFAVGSLTVLETAVLVLFVVLFAWVAFSFCTACIGFAAFVLGRDHTLGIAPDAPLPALAPRTALLAPTYNEDPVRLTARIEAMVGALADLGVAQQFDIFILSDTQDPDIWIAEEVQFLRLRERTAGHANIFYRHRAGNEGRKAGNIGEWVRRFGGAYAQMIVLDADSLMEGATMVRLVAAMERHSRVG